MKLNFNGIEQHIKNAVNIANQILNNSSFYSEISNLPQMQNTKFSSIEIANIMQNSNQEIQVVTFRPINPFSKVNATTINESLIKINTKKFSLDIKTAVNTLVHESVHAADFLNGEIEFSHSTNSPINQEKTAPWVIGALAEKYV